MPAPFVGAVAHTQARSETWLPPPCLRVFSSPVFLLAQAIVAETLAKLPDLEADIWAKVFYMERGHNIAKLYLREREVIIDNTRQEYDGYV